MRTGCPTKMTCAIALLAGVLAWADVSQPATITLHPGQTIHVTVEQTPLIVRASQVAEPVAAEAAPTKPKVRIQASLEGITFLFGGADDAWAPAFSVDYDLLGDGSLQAGVFAVGLNDLDGGPRLQVTLKGLYALWQRAVHTGPLPDWLDGVARSISLGGAYKARDNVGGGYLAFKVWHREF